MAPRTRRMGEVPARFVIGDKVILVDPQSTDEHRRNREYEVTGFYTGYGETWNDETMINVRGTESYHDRLNGTFHTRYDLASECGKCKHDCKMEEKCGLYEEGEL